MSPQPFRATAEVDPSLGLIAVIVYAVDQAMTIAGVPISLEDAQAARGIADASPRLLSWGRNPTWERLLAPSWAASARP